MKMVINNIYLFDYQKTKINMNWDQIQRNADY
jgi:hypothetical protein